MSKELNQSGLYPKYGVGMKNLIHAMTRQPVEVVKVKPGSQVVSYMVKTKKGKPFDAMEGELCFPPIPREKKRRWSDDEDEKDNSRDSRDRDRD